jgi:hypothetical protein
MENVLPDAGALAGNLVHDLLKRRAEIPDRRPKLIRIDCKRWPKRKRELPMRSLREFLSSE